MYISLYKVPCGTSKTTIVIPWFIKKKNEHISGMYVCIMVFLEVPWKLQIGNSLVYFSIQ